MQIGRYDLQQQTQWPTVGADIVDPEPFRNRDGVELTVSDFAAWPRQTFNMVFDWNAVDQRWHWGVTLDNAAETSVVTYQPVGYAKPCQFRQYILFMFVDFAQNRTTVTPETIFQSVELIAIPGPASPGFNDWIENQVTADDLTVEQES